MRWPGPLCGITPAIMSYIPYWDTVILNSKMFLISLAYWLPAGKRRSSYLSYLSLHDDLPNTKWLKIVLLLSHTVAGVQGFWAWLGMAYTCCTRSGALATELGDWSRDDQSEDCSLMGPGVGAFCCPRTVGWACSQHTSCVPRAHIPGSESGTSPIAF